MDFIKTVLKQICRLTSYLLLNFSTLNHFTTGLFHDIMKKCVLILNIISFMILLATTGNKAMRKD